MNKEMTLAIKHEPDTIPLRNGESFTKQIAVFKWTESGKDGKDYDKMLMIEFAGKGMQHLATVEVGDVCEVSFDVSSREWADKNGEVRYFTTAKGWFVKKAEDVSEEPLPSQVDDNDGLPF
jgi:hypothetical protein